jgi:hypothetical protein
MLDTLGHYLNREFDQETYQRIEGPLFKHYPRSAAPYFVKGQFYLNYAWKARGSGSSDRVTPEGWKLFGERLAIAKPAFEKAWQLDASDPQPPTQMIRVATDAQMGREEMELWFQRAMQAKSNNWDACNNKLRYLYPQWYSSNGEMLQFGRECLTNQAWGGSVTLMIVDAHQAIVNYSGEGKNYWKRPEVWPDIHAAYEEF